MGMDVYGKSGNYFRASCFNWGKFYNVIRIVNQTHGLGFDLKGWDYNEGLGLDSQADCDRLADAIEEYHANPGRFQLDFEPCAADEFGAEILGMLQGAGFKDIYTGDDEHTTEYLNQRLPELIKFLRECNGFSIC